MSAKDLAIAATLREHGLRVTPQRRAIWNAFEGGRSGHLTADEVLRRARAELPELARGTVYNALTEFVSVGLLGTFDGGASQLYDANVEPHQHFRCKVCAVFYDVRPAGLEELSLDEPGFSVDRTHILFEGTCASCAARG